MSTADALQTIVGKTDSIGEKIFTASQWRLMWWKYRKHGLAVFSTAVVALFYFMALFCEFLAPYPLDARDSKYALAPPQSLHFFGEDGFHLRPFVYGREKKSDPETWRITFEEDKEEIHPIRLFVHGQPYKFWGLWETDLHLFGVDDPDYVVSLLGMDKIGRDMLSRLIYGARISLSIGLIGIFLTLIIGAVLGGISGYYGGIIDNLVQRVIEMLRSIPQLPLWMALSAALPPTLSPVRVYFGITVILSVLGWTGLARVVRGKILSLREEDFVMAARLAGAAEMRIIVRHLLPSFMSHLIVSITMSIPGMILAETSLSFLGIGLRPPVTSWGVLLQSAQQVEALAHYPWFLSPVFFIIAAVLAFNFVGDGLRDAVDPYVR
jgi:peptide/nickel transport system permease protein